jgi:hypothetical protein
MLLAGMGLAAAAWRMLAGSRFGLELVVALCAGGIAIGRWRFLRAR